MRKGLRTLRSRVGRVMRDVERQLGAVTDDRRAGLQKLIGRTKRILSQKTKDRNKLYALHAPEVERRSVSGCSKEGPVSGLRKIEFLRYLS
jgi:IS5 family transposase